MTPGFWMICLACIPLFTGLSALFCGGNVVFLRNLFFISGIALPLATVTGMFRFLNGDNTASYLSSLPILPLVFSVFFIALALFPGVGIKKKPAFTGIASAFFIISAIIPISTLFPIESISVNVSSDIMLPLSFRLEGLSVLFTLMISVLWLPALLYALSYMERNNEQGLSSFFFYYCLAVSFTLLLGLSGNALTLFLFYEALSLSTFPLVTHKRNEDAKNAGRVYLGILLFGSLALLLPGLALFYGASGSLDFVEGGHSLTNKPGLTLLVTAMIVFGAAKCGIMPLHKWLPSAMVAPTPVSALLHAVAVVKAGVFTVIKCVFLLIGTDNISSALDTYALSAHPVIYVAGITILVASTIAMFQQHLKRMLAYSTISQLSYIVMASMIAVPGAVTAGMMHMTAHAFAKITLFFAAGAFYTGMKRHFIGELNGMAYTMPVTAASFSLGALSMIGLPPMAGFWGKWYIFTSTFHAGLMFPVIVLIISTLLNVAYFLPIIYRMYFTRPQHKDGTLLTQHEISNVREPRLMMFALPFTASLGIALFFYPEIVTRMTDALSSPKAVVEQLDNEATNSYTETTTTLIKKEAGNGE